MDLFTEATRFHFVRYGDDIYDIPRKWTKETEDLIYDLYCNTVQNGKSYLYYGTNRNLRVTNDCGWKTFRNSCIDMYRLISMDRYATLKRL